MPPASRRSISLRSLPKEPYEATGRWVEYGDNLFRLKDRHGNDFLLAPTHEEMFTLLVKGLFGSYKDLPLSIYQIQTKFRDEARPRAGLLRGREFVMKDSYSFDIDDEGLQRSYDRHREAYIKTFERLGLPTVIVSAMSGAMGGSASEEFLTPLEVGEDTYVRCSSCDYAANTEAFNVTVPDAVALDGLAGRQRGRHPEHADDPDIRRPSQRSPRPGTHRSAVDCGGHDEERDRQVAPPRRHHRATGDRCARRSRGRHEAARGAGRAGRGRGVRRGRLRPQRGAGEGLHRTRRARHRRQLGDPLPDRSTDRRGHALGHRRQRVGQARDRSHLRS